MKPVNLLIRGLDNCSLGGNFRVSRHAEICQFDRFSLEINFKRARSCNYEIPRLVQVKMKILHLGQEKSNSLHGSTLLTQVSEHSLPGSDS